ncbi:hypothetical protein [Ruegeria conchae]|uniref:Uncharacterized protein n=1 Tax=Ruegeria conchae TaxID=981384 RepID=A0A497ZYA3_9RHOB|nr:hypothetical protein [Ruegeria conchae]RLK11343.1 hypothetical protein CLV75_1344 [Ruegeria conchae]
MNDLQNAEKALWAKMTKQERAIIAARIALRLLPNTSFGTLSQNPAVNLTHEFRQVLIQVVKLFDQSEATDVEVQVDLIRASLSGTIEVVEEFKHQAPVYAARSAAAAAQAARTQQPDEVARAASDAAEYAANASRASEAAKIAEAICHAAINSAVADIEAMRTKGKVECFATPLLDSKNKNLLQFWDAIQTSIYGKSNLFGFWQEWYQGFLDGKPIDWELQRRVALIDDDIWKSSSEEIAEEIERIRTRWEVEKALTDLSDSLSVRTTARHGIGGNNPPESIQDERLYGAATLIWEAEEELSTALEQENPAHDWIEAILAKFKAGLTSLLKWCAGKVNLAVGTAIVVGATKGSTVVVDAYIAKHPEKIEALIEALERWLPFLS